MICSPVGAQTNSQPESQAEAPAEDNNGLQEIVVTVQKRSENLQSVPIAITAVSGSDLTARGIPNLAQLNTVVSGLNFRIDRGQFLATVRGIGTNAGSAENPVDLVRSRLQIAVGGSCNTAMDASRPISFVSRRT